MLGPLKNGCHTIKKTKKYEIYRLGEKIYKFIFKKFLVKELKRL